MENENEKAVQASGDPAVHVRFTMRHLYTVLVADDDESIRDFLVMVLADAGYATLEADNGRAAVEIAVAHQPDAALLDVVMPVMDGVAACRALKSDARTTDIPVLLLTTDAGSDQKVRWLDDGASDYLTKPFSVVELLARLRMVIVESQRRRTLMAEVAELRRLVGKKRKPLVARLRIFVASPSDVQEERKALGTVVDELNRTIGREKDVMLDLVRWETDIVPDMGPPQEVINRQIEKIGPYDIFVGIMWRRFGTPTEHAASGTQEEFQLAYESYSKTGRPRIMFYFKQAAAMFTTVHEAEQVVRVLTFRDELGKKGLYTIYNTVFDFERYVREHLTKRIGELLEG